MLPLSRFLHQMPTDIALWELQSILPVQLSPTLHSSLVKKIIVINRFSNLYALAMVNKNMPRTFGDGVIHVSHIDYLVNEADGFELHQRNIGQQNEQEKKIGQIIAENLVDNGATLQMG